MKNHHKNGFLIPLICDDYIKKLRDPKLNWLQIGSADYTTFCNHLTHSEVSEVPYVYLTGSGSVAGLLIQVWAPLYLQPEGRQKK